MSSSKAILTFTIGRLRNLSLLLGHGITLRRLSNPFLGFKGPTKSAMREVSVRAAKEGSTHSKKDQKALLCYRALRSLLCCMLIPLQQSQAIMLIPLQQYQLAVGTA